CRASTGGCDPAENCTGNSATCPADVLSPNGFTCSPITPCSNGATCNGMSAMCPAAQSKPDGTICNTSFNICKSGMCIPGCFIAGVAYANGTVNPANACQVCVA